MVPIKPQFIMQNIYTQYSHFLLKEFPEILEIFFLELLDDRFCNLCRAPVKTPVIKLEIFIWHAHILYHTNCESGPVETSNNLYTALSKNLSKFPEKKSWQSTLWTKVADLYVTTVFVEDSVKDIFQEPSQHCRHHKTSFVPRNFYVIQIISWYDVT